LLLVLDPSGHYDKLRTEAGMSTMSHIRKSMYTFKAKEYQLVTVSGIITSDSEFEVSIIICHLTLGFSNSCILRLSQICMCLLAFILDLSNRNNNYSIFSNYYNNLCN